MPPEVCAVRSAGAQIRHDGQRRVERGRSLGDRVEHDESGSEAGRFVTVCGDVEPMSGILEPVLHARDDVFESWPGIVRTLSTALASAGMTLPATPPTSSSRGDSVSHHRVENRNSGERLPRRAQLRQRPRDTSAAIAARSSQTGHICESNREKAPGCFGERHRLAVLAKAGKCTSKMEDRVAGEWNRGMPGGPARRHRHRVRDLLSGLNREIPLAARDHSSFVRLR